MPPVTKNLLFVNIIIWLAMYLFPFEIGEKLIKYGSLHFWLSDDFNPAQLFSYMFLHDNTGLTHIFFNMFSMVIFGKILEQVWGSKRFLFYYIVTGVGAGLIQEIAWAFTWQNDFALVNTATGDIAMQGKEAYEYAMQNGISIAGFVDRMVSVGASGAVFGILLAFGMMFPNAPMYLFFIPFPIKAKYLVIGYGFLEIFLGITGLQVSVAHFAHLGGMLFGIIILLIWRKKKTLGGENF